MSSHCILFLYNFVSTADVIRIKKKKLIVEFAIPSGIQTLRVRLSPCNCNYQNCYKING